VDQAPLPVDQAIATVLQANQICPVVLAVEHDRVKHGLYDLLEVPKSSVFLWEVVHGQRDITWNKARPPPWLGLNDDEVAVLAAMVSGTS